MKVKKFNKLFESKNNDIENLYHKFHSKICVSGLLYLLNTTNINPNINLGDGNTLAYLDEYESNINHEDISIYIELVKTLIEKGADINYLDINGVPPILLTNYKEIEKMLLDADCDLNIKVGENNDNMLDISPNLDLMITKFKIFENKEPLSINILLINFSDWNYIERWLEAGEDIDAQDSRDGWNLLLLNVNNNYEFIVKDLLELGANPNSQNDNGSTPLMIARTTDMMSLLIDAGADWNIKNNTGQYFLDTLDDFEKEYIIKKYPKKYKEYLKKKAINNFKI